MKKILIGTPVHESKDYAMERWLASVSKLDYPFDLLIVDNSFNPDYVQKIRGYCKKYAVTNYELIHVNVDRDSVLDERLAISREVIRKEILAKNYDAWFSLECDVIAPPDALGKLIDLIDDYWMVCHAYPGRDNSMDSNVEFGIALVKRKALEKYGFAGEYGYVDPLRPTCWYGGDVWFTRRIDRDNEGTYMHVYGAIGPIYHVAK